MAAEVSERTKEALGEKFEIHSNLFVVDNKRKNQTNDASRIMNELTHFSPKHFWVKKSRAGSFA